MNGTTKHVLLFKYNLILCTSELQELESAAICNWATHLATEEVWRANYDQKLICWLQLITDHEITTNPQPYCIASLKALMAVWS